MFYFVILKSISKLSILNQYQLNEILFIKIMFILSNSWSSKFIDLKLFKIIYINQILICKLLNTIIFYQETTSMDEFILEINKKKFI